MALIVGFFAFGRLLLHASLCVLLIPKQKTKKNHPIDVYKTSQKTMGDSVVLPNTQPIYTITHGRKGGFKTLQKGE